MNISNFMTWFIQQFINIGTNMLSILDNIQIMGNVTLMDFIITIMIISAFLEVLITIPNTANRIEKRHEKTKGKNK